MIRAVLFDLDGTFADTAADLARALNTMRARRRLAALPLVQLRHHASSGARGMLLAGFDLTPADPQYVAMRDEFHDTYADALCVESRWFDGIAEVVTQLEQRGLKWGIVTNKAARFTDPLVLALDIHSRAACVVCGDTTPNAKPHPAPLLHAADLIGVAPGNCFYVGDDKRDIDAANAAGMIGVAACYGYLGTDSDVNTWKAAHRIDSPRELIALLD